jgi:autotransporter-associated beta strand protein
VTFGGVISGTGNVQQSGPGTTTLSATNTYTGQTVITAGTLALDATGSIAASSVITANGTFDISASGGFVPIKSLAGSGSVALGSNRLVITAGANEFSGAIGGTGGVEIAGGTQTLSGANAYSNSTQIDSGATLALKGNGSIAQSASVIFAPCGCGGPPTLDISQTTTGSTVAAVFDPFGIGLLSLGAKTLTLANGGSFNGLIADGGIGGGTGGSVVLGNGGVTTFGGTNTYTGSTTVNLGGELDLTGTGSISTSSKLQNNGTFDISGLSNGGTSIKSLAGTGSVALGSNNLTLTNANDTFSGVIGGSGGLNLNGGTQTLSGVNTYTGPTSVNAGLLLITGALSAASSVTIGSGGTLGGTGTVGNTSIAGGTFQPGSGTAGTLMTVNGTLGFKAASTYAVNVNPTTASFANVSGTATLGGATVNAIFANGSYIAKQYTILNAGSINGTFGTLTNSNRPANFHDTLSYDATHAYLDLILTFTTPTPGGLNGNQNNVANALINFFNTTGGIPMAFATLNANALSQAAGQPGAATAQSGIGGIGQFINGVFDSAFDDNNGQGTTSFADENAYAAKPEASRKAKDAYAAVTPRDRRAPSFASRWAVWGTAYGGNSRISGDAIAGTSTTTSRLFGGIAGATYHFTPDTQAGFALGGAGSSFNLDGGFGGGKADIFNAAAYAKQNWGAAYVAGLLGYSWQDTTTDRTLSIAGVDQLHASFKAQALAARLEGGWRYATPMIGITPYAALQSISFRLPGYAETATWRNNTFALSYASKTVQATRGELGAKFDKAMLVQGGVFTLKAKTAWAHDWNTDRSAIATFQALPGATFTTNGAQPSANAALASLGAEMKWHNGWTLAGSFDGEFSRTMTGYSGKASIKYAW